MSNKNDGMTTDVAETAEVVKSEVITEKKVKKRIPLTTKKAAPVMYIGPSIPNVVQSSTVFAEGIPESLQKRIEDMPLIQKLLIPTNELPAAIKELRTERSALNAIYNKVKKTI